MAHEFELDKWSDKYAERTQNIKSSAIRDLLAVTEQPDIISLAGGLPETTIFDLKGIRGIFDNLISNDISAAFQYGPSDGYPPLKDRICEILAEEGIKAHRNELVITGGAQQALDLIGKVFINPGDEVIIEAPSYVGAINSFGSYQAKFVTVPMNDDGMDVSHLSKIARTSRAKFLYTVPNFQNPAGVTLSLERRYKLLDICKKNNIIVIEDNPYGRLRFEGEALPSLRSIDSEVIYLGTFSKIFSPGLRVGWVLAPGSFLEKLIHAKQAADLCSSSFTQRFVAKFFESNLRKKHLDSLINIYRERRDAMLSALKQYFPKGTSWTKPKGGFFVWASVPEFIDTKEMLAEALNKGVAYVPGSAFFPDESGKNFMRLAYCYVDARKINLAIKKLGKVIKEQIELYESLKF